MPVTNKYLNYFFFNLISELKKYTIVHTQNHLHLNLYVSFTCNSHFRIKSVISHSKLRKKTKKTKKSWFQYFLCLHLCFTRQWKSGVLSCHIMPLRLQLWTHKFYLFYIINIDGDFLWYDILQFAHHSYIKKINNYILIQITSFLIFNMRLLF